MKLFGDYEDIRGRNDSGRKDEADGLSVGGKRQQLEYETVVQ